MGEIGISRVKYGWVYTTGDGPFRIVQVLVGGDAFPAGGKKGSLNVAPGLTTVDASGLERYDRLVPVSRVEPAACVVITERESGDDLVAPVPDAVVGRPARVAPGDLVNGSVLYTHDVCRESYTGAIRPWISRRA